MIDKKAVSTVSEKTAREYAVAPIGFTNDRIRKKLIVATPNPSDFETIRKIKFESNFTVEPVYLMEEHLQWVINQCYQPMVDYDHPSP